MDAVLLARVQFGLTAGFHFLFPPTTFGLTFIILILESLYLRTKQVVYEQVSSFLIRLLGVVFALGVATGIVLEFAFGNNWAQYSRMVGDIFGAPLAAEGIFAFFLESSFLAILLFGRRKVSGRAFWWSAFLVFFAAHLSGLWIIIANSWMQTPAGFKMEGGRAVLTNFLEAVLNHSTVVRFVHTTLAGWITGSLLAAGIAAWFLLKGRHRERAQLLLKIALILFVTSSLLQLFSGHLHSVQVAKTQPEKMAAFEALWKTQKGAPMGLIGLPHGGKEKTYLSVKIPKLLSLLIYFDADAEVTGLDAFPRDERPPVFIPFASYHVMILLGALFGLMALSGMVLLLRKKWAETRWFLRALVVGIPLPYLANEVGWIAAEVGRQPWAVYRVLRTADAASGIVPAGNILFSLIMFTVIYALIGAVGIGILIRMIRQGPEETAPQESERGR
jgi:cytochrome bd ubiquinol oxidase subunit I